MRHSYASFAFLTPVGAPADMYFTPLASGGGSATYFLFLEVSAEAPRLFLNFPPLGFIPNSRNISPYICRFFAGKDLFIPYIFLLLLFFIELRFLFMIDTGKLL